MKPREFKLKFNKKTYDWFVLIQPTIKTEDGYETRVIEMSAYQALEARHKKLLESLANVMKVSGTSCSHYHIAREAIEADRKASESNK